MTTIVPSRAVLFAAAVVAATACGARADDVSPWISEQYSAVRLLAGSRSGAVLLGGIAFQLQPGWKTYWRTPGDSGVPPRFDFSKSENVEAVTILWPAPQAFPDGAGGTSLGYKGQVVLPLRIVTKHADKPVTLRATVDYAVCDKLCIPVVANPELEFASVASTQDGALAAALDTVPVPANIGDANPVAIRDVVRKGDKEVEVDVVAPAAAQVSLFVEGPTPEWALPVPKEIKGTAPGVRRFGFALEGLPSGAQASGAVLKFTLVGPDKAYEVNVTLE
ncbi:MULTISPECIES: protein-disulfide reductase DsbD domain-containing protein [Rhodopseudomonas]|jgi:DsbC/DsbD-like thiol-disulfide interchange protein|uniref:Thiol:disulfide interchange protein DsbD N-terminal domain-containing protein n=1 Tax=Rhodopseudomonas palustris (strain DX-1) TaxID=652103 RepID=E6VCJ8_RHOPX|nr:MULTISPECIES: protein-disulfide reductase DsbD domain-containing protein [Rhodopseudomonas]NEW88465.1 cytochrome C biogenesis protein [Rhodopseudomonas sp. WA056]QDL95923.1 cytochrome C biogenesis protein [Rhodopseudomonas palustris]